MDSGLTKTIGLAIVTAVLATFVTLANGGAAENTAAGTVATGADTVHRDSTVTIRWLTDANVMSLVAAMNAKQVALADAELQAWHSDTVRAYAAEIARNHAALQHSADSVAAQLHLAPLAPAVQDEIVAALQAHVDTVAMSRGPQMDRVFVQQSAAAHALVADYLAQMSAAAQAPEMQAFLENAQGRVSAEVTRAKQVQTMFAVADSVAADSVAKRAAARRNRQGQR
jgi:hypothetical protein